MTEETIQPTENKSPKKSSKKSVSIILIIIGMLIVGGVVFGYSYYFSPERIIKKMFKSLATVSSLEYSGSIEAKTKGDLLSATPLGDQIPPTPSEKQAVRFALDFNGSADILDLNNPKLAYSLKISTEKTLSPIGIDIITVNENSYIKLNNLPPLGIFDLSFLENQWVKLEAEALEQFGIKMEKKIEPQETQQKLSEEQIKNIFKAVIENSIFKATAKLPGEKIDGVNTYHYKVTLDKEGLKQLVIEVSKITQEKTLTGEDLKKLDDSLNTAEFPELEIWIGKKDLLPYKIYLNSTIKETDKTKVSGEFTGNLFFKNFNKPVEIKTPAEAKTLEEILMGLLSGFEDFDDFEETMPIMPTE